MPVLAISKYFTFMHGAGFGRDFVSFFNDVCLES